MTYLITDVEEVACLMCEWEPESLGLCQFCEDIYYIQTAKIQAWWQEQINPEG